MHLNVLWNHECLFSTIILHKSVNHKVQCSNPVSGIFLSYMHVHFYSTCVKRQNLKFKIIILQLGIEMSSDIHIKDILAEDAKALAGTIEHLHFMASQIMLSTIVKLLSVASKTCINWYL